LDGIDLVLMTQEQFDAWLPGTIEGYAKEHVATGRWSKDEAIEKSRQEHEKLLPQGVATPNHFLWFIVRSSDRQKVGLLWVNIVTEPTRHAFIFNIEIDEPFRRHGYAMQAMTRLEEEARRMGLDSIKLHVFGHNTAARPLYEKLGYVPTNINMSKTLTRPPAEH
jgi:ribosomal protein S18 acetylase RimI-like enzyme